MILRQTIDDIKKCTDIIKTYTPAFNVTTQRNQLIAIIHGFRYACIMHAYYNLTQELHRGYDGDQGRCGLFLTKLTIQWKRS